MLSIPVSFGAFFASLAAQSISAQIGSNDCNYKADGTLNMNSFKITNLAPSTEDNHGVTKKYL